MATQTWTDKHHKTPTATTRLYDKPIDTFINGFWIYNIKYMTVSIVSYVQYIFLDLTRRPVCVYFLSFIGRHP